MQPAEDTVRVPSGELKELRDLRSSIPERERVLRGLMASPSGRPSGAALNGLPALAQRFPKRELSPQQKAERAKRRAVRNAQRAARKLNRPRRKR